MTQRESLVRCTPTSGEVTPPARFMRGICRPMIELYAMSGPSDHIAALSNDVSTTQPRPVRNVCTRPAQTPPARNIPEGTSPRAGRCITRRGASGSVRMWPIPPRDQNDTESKPPASASGPRWPWP